MAWGSWQGGVPEGSRGFHRAGSKENGSFLSVPQKGTLQPLEGPSAKAEPGGQDVRFRREAALRFWVATGSPLRSVADHRIGLSVLNSREQESRLRCMTYFLPQNWLPFLFFFAFWGSLCFPLTRQNIYGCESIYKVRNRVRNPHAIQTSVPDLRSRPCLET